MILATNPTVEGEATAHYIGELVSRRGIRATRIAHGVPVGGELDTWTAERSRTRSPDASSSPEVGRRGPRAIREREQPLVALEAAR